MTKIKFYEITKRTLEELAEKNGIKDLNKYYELTDFSSGSLLGNYSEKNSGKDQVFAQLAFHAQNAMIISNIVNFKKKLPFLDKTLCAFNPEKFLKEYGAGPDEDAVLKIVEALRYNEKTKEGLKWNLSKSKPENKDKMVKRYAYTLLDCARFLKKFNSKEEFLDNLEENYKDKNVKKLICYFRKQIKHGFSIALTCDFLKEFSSDFDDLPKPDIHIKDTMGILYNRGNNYYNTNKKIYDCIGEMQSITSGINEKLPPSEKITVRKLDRMIWLICSGKFFLDDKNAEGSKKDYLQKLEKITD